MNEMTQIITDINNSKIQSQPKYDTLFEIIKKNENQISQKETITAETSVLFNFFLKRFLKPTTQFYKFLKNFLQFAYTKQPKLLKIVYQIIPLILCKYIQGVDQKVPNIQSCAKLIYNKEYANFNKNLTSRELLMAKNGEIGSLYKQNFHTAIKTILSTTHLIQIMQAQEVNATTRVSIKSVILFSIFNNLQILSDKAIISYLWMIYVYCGGNQLDDQTGVSLYLLQKKNMFSIFKYYMSQQQMSIILLTLYQLSMQRKKNKFELLSAINMIHKKAANQSMFKLSQVAQSTIHLLQDQYNDAFS